MKVYYVACDADWKSGLLINDYLAGRYPEEPGGHLYVTATLPDTTHIWSSMVFHGISVERVYEIDLPHSEAELAYYQGERQPPKATYWSLPWYIVAGHPVKMMEARIEHHIMGKAETADQHDAPD